ncbi:NAD(P)-dependent oxidoreductase [Rummeliibacillus sp. JY-2-4R]
MNVILHYRGIKMENIKIGFIGLGNIGLPMATNLIRANYQVIGFDTNSETVKKFIEAGGKEASSVETLSNQSDVIMTSLPTPQIVRQVYLGVGGILESAKPTSLLIDFSTVDPGLNDEIRAKSEELGLDYLGAPVSGGVIGAVNATLTIMVGGKQTIYERALPYLEPLGTKPFHLGESASIGTQIKLLNNLMIGFYTEAVAETVTLAEQAGISAEKLYQVLHVSYGQSSIYERNYQEFIKREDYEPGFSTNLLLKDLKLASVMAEQVGSPLPIGNQLIELYENLVNEGYGEQDISAAYLAVKDKVSKN